MARIGDDQYASKGEVKRLNDLMFLGIMVLIVAFLILIVTLALDFINAMRDDTSSRNDLIHEVQQLEIELHEQKAIQKSN